MSNIAGILPFNSGHASVVGEATLTDSGSILAWGVGSIIENGATINSVLGIKAGSVGACRLRGHIDLLKLDVAGQFSFDIESSAIGTINANTESEGSVFTNNTYVYTNRESGAVYGRTYINASNAPITHLRTSDPQAQWQTHTLGNDRFSRVTVSWNYGVTEVYVNGKLITSSARAITVPNIWTEIHLGSNRGIVSSGASLTLQNHYMRNVVLATSPVTLSRHQQLRRIVMFGDSFVAQADISGAPGFFHNNASRVIKGKLALVGIYSHVYVDGHSGASINIGSGNTLASFRDAMLATSPDLVIYQAGANDAAASGGVAATLQTDLDTEIAAILAGTVARIIVGNAPTAKANAVFDTPQYVSQVAEVNAIMSEAGARWDAANPGDTGRVTHYDLFNALGGEVSVSKAFNGQVGAPPLYDDRHPSAKGQLIMGEIMAQAVLGALK